jgi:hypothetical protein
MYEYACHEGNDAMRNLLSGARAEEKAGSDARREQHVRQLSSSLLTIGVTVSAAAVLVTGLRAQDSETTAARLAKHARAGRITNTDGLDVLQLRPNFYVIPGAGDNVPRPLLGAA